MNTIKVPLINTNEPEALVADWLVEPWAKVNVNDPICTIETTKSTFDIEADVEGYIYPIIEEGIYAKVGSILGYIFPSDDPKQLIEIETNDMSSGGRIISQKAKKILENNSLSINELPGTGPIKADDVLSYIEQRIKITQRKDNRLNKIDVNKKSLLLYCAGDHADVLFEAILSGKKYEVIGFIDYLGQLNIKEKFGLPVFNKNQLSQIRELGVKNIHINTNNYELTKEIYRKSTELDFDVVNIFHTSSIISPTAIMGVNIFVGANAIVGTKSEIGDFTKILNGASIAHHSKIGKNCQISDGARIAGNAIVGNNCLIGLNATVNMKIIIGNKVTIISGASAYSNIPSNTIARK